MRRFYCITTPSLMKFSDMIRMHRNIAEEWKENFRMSKNSLYKLAEELEPYIKGKDTMMRPAVEVVKQVACTLCYLSDAY